jgi:ribosome-associated translation inhibitor RaiA
VEYDMPNHPVEFEFRGLPFTRAAEAAARRRLRGLESACPLAQAWRVKVEALPDAAQPIHFRADVRASVSGGDLLQTRAQGEDPLAALRLAFNALETALARERDSERHLAGRWLRAVRSRLGRQQEVAGLGLPN